VVDLGAVDQHAQEREEIRQMLDLVDDDQAADPLEDEGRLRQARAISRVVEIEPLCRRIGCDLARQRGLADLASAEQGHHGELAHQGSDPGRVTRPVDHTKASP